jgi:branched-chain amino acid transport system ATP-binding protein
MLEIRDLHVSYGKIRAVRGVSMRVDQGEIIALIGLNGAGKSTLLKAVAGINRCDSGTIEFKGEAIQNRTATETARRGIAMVLEGRSTLKHMSVLENLMLGSYMRRDRAGIPAEIDALVERFPALKPRLRQNAGTLSGGEQQMLVIARALLSKPSLLLLDEPSLGLAPLVIAGIFELIRELNREGMTILLVEQNARQALQLSHRGYVLETGRLVLEGRDLVDDPRVREAYLGV